MTTPGSTRHCTFRVGDHRLAVEADAVAEVLSARPATRVPLAPPAVIGLVHLRGRIVPILDPAVRLGLPVPVDRAAATHLVLRLTEHEWCGLAVDEVLDVVDVPPTAFEQPTSSDADTPVTGVFTAPDGLVHVLDLRRMFHPPQRPRPPAS
jgi:purine-binding chemotaxis protein CheW